MNAQQLLDYIIKPTLEYMGGNYNSKNAQMLLLSTAAIESKCGYYIKQINGPALGIWQMEPATHEDIWDNCDAMKGDNSNVESLATPAFYFDEELIINPKYASAMARLKYSMDIALLPFYGDIYGIYEYHKRIYNTPLTTPAFYFHEELIINPKYACAMARLKYSMDIAPLPFYGDIYGIYEYYKRIYNTPLGASTFEKFKAAWEECGLDDVVL